MKKLFILSSFLLSVGASVFAQHPAAKRLMEQTPLLVKHQNIPVLINPNPTHAQATGNETLVLKTYTESNVGKHYLYQQMHDGLPIYGAYLKVNTNKKGDVLNSFSTLVDVTSLDIVS